MKWSWLSRKGPWWHKYQFGGSGRSPAGSDAERASVLHLTELFSAGDKRTRKVLFSTFSSYAPILLLILCFLPYWALFLRPEHACARARAHVPQLGMSFSKVTKLTGLPNNSISGVKTQSGRGNTIGGKQSSEPQITGWLLQKRQGEKDRRWFHPGLPSSAKTRRWKEVSEISAVRLPGALGD